MKIALITLEYPPAIMGGAGVYVAQVAPKIARMGHEVHVIAPGTATCRESRMEAGIHVHRLPVSVRPALKTLSFWAALPQFFQAIARKAGGFDLVHGNGISDLTLSRLAVRQPRIVTVHHLSSSCVQSLRPSLFERVRQPGGELGLVPYLEPLAIRRAQHIVAVSEYTKQDLVATLRIDPTRISVIRHGAQPEDYRFPAEELARVRQQWQEQNEPLILCVGRLEARKGIDVLLRAFAQALQETSATLLLVGSGSHAPYRALAAELTIMDRVKFVGHVDTLTLRQLYAACNVFAFPSLLEGLGIVALEARAAGKFIVASRVGGIPEIVPPGAGLLVPPGDVESLASALVQSLDQRPTALPPLTWDAAGQQLCDLYDSALNQWEGLRARIAR
jgi:glycosyltransferase involved in cell wall biosynthesis